MLVDLHVRGISYPPVGACVPLILVHNKLLSLLIIYLLLHNLAAVVQISTGLVDIVQFIFNFLDVLILKIWHLTFSVFGHGARGVR
jgi:hypothetical protein